MTSQEAALYREIQKNAEMGRKAIETITDKVYDEGLASQLSRQSLRYSEIHNAAAKQLVAGKADYYRGSALADAMLKTGLHYNTLLNTSTERIAELMIKGSTNGMIEMEKALKRNEAAGEKSVSLAKQLLKFEEESVTELRKYL